MEGERRTAIGATWSWRTRARLCGVFVAGLTVVGPVRRAHAASDDVDPPASLADKIEERRGTMAGTTTIGFDGRFALEPSAPYRGGARLVMRTTQYGHGTSWTVFGADLGVGFAAAPGGFAYDLGLRAGPGHWFGDRFALGLYSGVGIDGVVQSVPFAVQSPLGVSVQLNLMRGLTLAARGEGRWCYATGRVDAGGPLGWDGHAVLLDVGTAHRTDSTDPSPDPNLVLGAQWVRIGSADYFGAHLGTGSATDPW